jgi:NAD(P)-dependent dehydrogenase (short-subunit alcohol dehydrogenase family)
MTETDDDSLFVDDAPDAAAPPGDAWVVLSVDDDPAVHLVSRLAFSDLVVDGRRLELVEAHSADEARRILSLRGDIAVVLLDVVMETEEAGIGLAGWIRARPERAALRIVLRTGQPGRAPEASVLQRHEISDYWPKTELTAPRARAMLSAQVRVFGALRRAEERLAGVRDALARGDVDGARRLVSAPVAPPATTARDESATPRRVLVTGASSGFGARIARALAAQGHTVFAALRDPDGRNAAAAAALRAEAAAGGWRLTTVALDVTSDASVDACAAGLDAAGGVDAVVQNAGVAAAGLMETFSAAAAERVFAVNVFGAHRVLRAVLPQMRRAGGGLVVWLSSTDGREVMPFLGVYDASKAAVEALAEAWRYELHALNVRTVVVQPGTFPTTSILANLVPADAPERAAAYGALADAPGQLFAGLDAMVREGRAPDPSQVADAVCAAFRGGSPPRVVVDPSGFDGAARINAVCDAVQADLLARLGLSALAAP